MSIHGSFAASRGHCLYQHSAACSCQCMDLYKLSSKYPAMQKEAKGIPFPDFLSLPFYFGAVTGHISKLSSDLPNQLFLKNSFPPRFPPPNPRLFLFQRMSFAAQLHNSLCLVTKGQHSAARGRNQNSSTYKGFTSNLVQLALHPLGHWAKIKIPSNQDYPLDREEQLKH